MAPLEIVAEMKASPQEQRDMEIKALMAADYRPHAVCTVQTFKNAQSGTFLCVDPDLQVFNFCTILISFGVCFILFLLVDLC